MFFTNEYYRDILVSSINLTRATQKEAEQYRNVLLQEIKLKRKKIIVDLSECEFIDLTFIGALVFSLKKLIPIGGELKLVNLKHSQNSLLEMIRLNRIFEVFDSRDDAIVSFFEYAQAV